MARPREFDEQAVVQAAALVFQRRGYTSTSVDDLVNATGLHRGSLYNVFGSKYGVLRRVLDAVDQADADRELRLDIVLVCLLELAPEDRIVRAHVGRLVETYAISPESLGDRLLARAGLSTVREWR